VTTTRPTLTDTEDAAVTTTGETATVGTTTVEVTTTEEVTTGAEPETTTIVETETVATTVLPETTTEETPTEPTTTEETPTETVPTETAEPVSSRGQHLVGLDRAPHRRGARHRDRATRLEPHRAGSATWSGAYADLRQRTLSQLDLVLAQGSVVTGQVQALADEARRLEARAPNDRARAAAGATRERLDELARTLESDRALRLASPPPSQEQLSYSQALIRNQVLQLQQALRPPA
jgi:hypothetical protein